MWVPKESDWGKDHTSLSKYFIERLKQRVDYSEIISNKHRTTNGFTLVCEIVDVCNLTILREKSIHRLISLLKEACSTIIKSSIVNDYILKKYHADIINYYQQIDLKDIKKDNRKVIDLKTKSEIFKNRLNTYYYSNVKSELLDIDFKSTDKFKRYIIKIDYIIECLIPYLLHIGYSPNSIDELAFNYSKRDKGYNVPITLFNQFNSKKKQINFLLATTECNEFNIIKRYLENKGLQLIPTTVRDIESFAFEVSINFIKENNFYTFNAEVLDPHNFIRNLYERSLKSYVTTKDRLSLQYFQDFFDKIFWKPKTSTFANKFKKSKFHLDPININERGSTLHDTIVKVSQGNNKEIFDTESNLPYIKEIQDSVFFYNLALGSKSIENSIFLLWTSLETLLPYRTADNDITSVQYFVSKSLSIGSIGREVFGFTNRLYEAKHNHNDKILSLPIPQSFYCTNQQFVNIFKFLMSKWDDSDPRDPYYTLKPTSELLCQQYCRLNELFNSADINYINTQTITHFLEKIERSNHSITFQLDRIYLHRNQIVHTGKFVNEYSNLWSHLEWYVGKLLAYLYIKNADKKDHEDFNKKDYFMELEADYDYIQNTFKNLNKKKKIDTQKVTEIIFKHTWQFF